jgi:hypothetical protein
VAWFCSLYNLNYKIFVPIGTKNEVNKIDANLIERDMNIDELDVAASLFSVENKGYYYIQSSLYDRDYIKALSEGFMNVRDAHVLKPRGIWIAESSTVALALGKAFPRAKLNIVLSDGLIRKNLIRGINYKTWEYRPQDDKLSETSPFDAPGVNSNIWHFAKRYGRNDDLIWIG